MRFMFKITIPVEAGNAAIRDGTMGKKMRQILDDMHPEAAYLIVDKGQRSLIVVAEIDSMEGTTAYYEPWFLAFNAQVETYLAWVPEDLDGVIDRMESIIEKYG